MLRSIALCLRKNWQQHLSINWQAIFRTLKKNCIPLHFQRSSINLTQYQQFLIKKLLLCYKWRTEVPTKTRADASAPKWWDGLLTLTQCSKCKFMSNRKPQLSKCDLLCLYASPRPWCVTLTAAGILIILTGLLFLLHFTKEYV